MTLPTFIWKAFVIVAVLNTATFLPSFSVFKLDTLVAFRNACKCLFSHILRLMEKLTLAIARYCSEDLNRDLERLINILNYYGKKIGQIFSYEHFKFFEKIKDALSVVHSKGMEYTEDILIQMLGIQGRLLPDDSDTPRNKFISLLLFVLWLIVGLIFISRLSYNRFFVLMASTFLLHAIFGPVWCLRQLAFGTGLCLWLGSLVSSKPIPAALAVLLLFGITGFRKWQKHNAQVRSQSELLQSNKSMEQRIENIERKLTAALEKLDLLVENACSE